MYRNIKNSYAFCLYGDSNISKLKAPATFVGFSQPWYEPVNVDVADLGMSIGGVGSTVTLTPYCSVSSLNVLSGLSIDVSDTPVKLLNFSYSESHVATLPKIEDYNRFLTYSELYKFTKDGEAYWNFGKSRSEAEQCLQQMVQCPNFYRSNKSILEQYKVSFSARSRRFIVSGSGDYQDLNISLLFDIFEGCLTRSPYFKTSLIGDVKQKTFSALPAFPCESMTHQSCFPVAISSYDGNNKVNIKRVDYSVLDLGGAKCTSLPAIFSEFQFENNNDEDIEITLFLGQENFVGYNYQKSRPGQQDSSCNILPCYDGQYSEAFHVEGDDRVFQGIRSSRQTGGQKKSLDGSITFGCVVDKEDVDVEISFTPNYATSHEFQVVNTAHNQGFLSQHDERKWKTGVEPVSSAICVSLKLSRHTSKVLRFVSVLDFASTCLTQDTQKKAYTQFFGPEKNRVHDMVSFIIRQWPQLQKRTLQSQHDIIAKCHLQSPHIPDVSHRSPLSLSQQLINSWAVIYNAAIWTEDNNILVRESVDYPFLNSLDVYFYGGFAVASLLPEADAKAVRKFSDAIKACDLTEQRFNTFANRPWLNLDNPPFEGVRLEKGAVPHDMGSVWDYQTNAYRWHDTAHWRDLAPKFVLILYRAYKDSGDITLLQACWESAKICIERQRSDCSELCIPFASKQSDTFDNLESFGVCIYSGSLWVASLICMEEIAKELKDLHCQKHYGEIAETAKINLLENLWDDARGCYQFYSVPVENADFLACSDECFQKIIERIGLKHCGSKAHRSAMVNAWLNNSEAMVTSTMLNTIHENIHMLDGLTLTLNEHIAGLGQRRISSKVLKKAYLYCLLCECGQRASYTRLYQKIMLESDDVFADQLVADLYLEILDLPCITSVTRRSQVLAYIYKNNFQDQLYNVGASNMVRFDGKRHEEFQAQDIWVGIQYSLVAQMYSVGMMEEAETLLISLEKTLHETSHMRYSPPEGFNCSCGVTVSDIRNYFGISQENALQVFQYFVHLQLINFAGEIVQPISVIKENLDKSHVHGIIIEMTQRHGICRERTWGLFEAVRLKYTGVMYFRSGMCHILPRVIERIVSKKNSKVVQQNCIAVL